MIPVVTYTPDSVLRRPGRLFRDMVRDLLASRELAWRLLVRDLRAQYRQSLLGTAWAFLPAIVTALGCTFASEAKILNVAEVPIPYPAYVLIGMVLWQTFLGALTGPMQVITSARPMLARINFPRESLLLANLGEVLFNFALRLIPVVLLLAWYRVGAGPALLLAPLALLMLVLLGATLGMLLAPIGLLYHDVQRGISLISGFWMLTTPVIYPAPTSGVLGRLVRLNPVTPLLETTRELMTTGDVSNPAHFLAIGALTLAAAPVAWVAFRMAIPYAIERVTS